MELLSMFHNSCKCVPRRALLELLSEMIKGKQVFFYCLHVLAHWLRGKTYIGSTMDGS